MKRPQWLLLLGALLAFVQTSCTKETKIIEKQAPQDVSQSMQPTQLTPNDDVKKLCAGLSCITLQKEALGKIFLLIASGKTSGATPQWYDLKPLVVSFERSGKQVVLLGENYNSIYEEIKTVNLIQSFDLVSEDETTLTFDWGKGLKTLILQSSYDVDGVRPGQDITESSFQSLPVLDSFVRDIRFDDKNLELEQISKIQTNQIKAGSDRSKMDIESREETIAMNIQIRSYNLSSSFKAKEYDKSRRVGFFVTKVAKKGMSNEIQNLITKWDISEGTEPIMVRLSAAIPEEYLGAIEEGVLYWNHVFGKEVLKVVKGEDPQASPKNRSITVRWIPWLDSGAAYAMTQSDPLSGEILRAQVFMPSVFTRVGSANLVQLNGDQPVAVGAMACDFSHRIKATAELMREADHSQRLRIARASVRATLSHEIGHALGLRHNFAGSFSAKVTANEVDKEAKDFLRHEDHPGLETSTSIMDYVSGVDEILMSARLKVAALAYDKMALDWAYAEGAATGLDEAVSRYCTDDDISMAMGQKLEIYGCERFDAGQAPIHRTVLDAKREKNNFVKVLFTSIVGRTFPGETTTKLPIESVLADTGKWGRLDLTSLEKVSKFLMNLNLNGAPVHSFASLDNVKTGRVLYSKFGVDKELKNDRLNSLNSVGGYGQLMNSLWRDDNGQLDIQWLERQIQELKDSAYLRSGQTLTGREYSLSEDEQAKIIEFFEGLIPLNKGILEKGLVTLLPKVRVTENTDQGKVVVSAILEESAISTDDVDLLGDLFLDLVTAHVDTVSVKVGPLLSKTITLPVPYLKTAQRAQWFALLAPEGLRFNTMLKRAQLLGAQTQRVKDVLDQTGAGYSMDQLEGLTKRLREEGFVDSKAASWLDAEIELLTALK